MTRCHWSLMCSPQPIARLLRALPKLAIIFLAVHFILMIYSVVNQPPHTSKNARTKVSVGNLKPAMDHISQAGIIGNLSYDKVDRPPSRLNKTKMKRYEDERMSEIRKHLASIKNGYNKKLGRTAPMI